MLQLPQGEHGTIFWIPQLWIYNSFFNSTLDPPLTHTGGNFDVVDYPEIRKIYKFMYHTRFDTDVTVTFDSDN